MIIVILKMLGVVVTAVLGLIGIYFDSKKDGKITRWGTPNCVVASTAVERARKRRRSLLIRSDIHFASLAA